MKVARWKDFQEMIAFIAMNLWKVHSEKTLDLDFHCSTIGAFVGILLAVVYVLGRVPRNSDFS